MGIFDNTLGGQTKQKPKGGGIFANTISRQRPQQQYHASVDSRGTSLGFSDERDTSGRPFFAYRNPGDTSTTTDYKRVATQFDPRIATTTPRDSFYNPRDPRIGDSDKRTQIDHKMALALSGSNNPANLRTVPNAQNRDSGIIRDLQGNVIAGRNSLFQAQSDLAIEKKTPLPFTGSRYGQFALEAKQAQEEARKAQSFGGLFKNTLSDLKSRFINFGQKVSEAVPGVRAIADMGVQGSFEPIIKHASTIGTKEHQERLLGKKDYPIKNKEGKTLGYTYSPKNQMNFALGFVNPVGGEGTVLDKIAKEKSFSVIKNLLKKIGDYSDDVVEKLVRTDTVDEVTSILRSNRTIRQVEFSETANLLPAKEAVAKGLTAQQYVADRIGATKEVLGKPDSVMGKQDFRVNINVDGKNYNPPNTFSYTPTSQTTKAKGTLPKATSALDPDVAQSLRAAKGLSAQDIITKHPDINLKRDVPVTDIYGNKSVIPAGEALTPYELKGNKVALKDGETYIVSKSQAQNVMNNAQSGEAKTFAPELKGTEETVKGQKEVGLEFKKGSNGDFTAGNITIRPEKDNFFLFGTGDNIILGRNAKTFKEATILAQRHVDSKIAPTKFSSFQLPDGKNYKEILIKAPNVGEQNVIEMQRLQKGTASPEDVAKYIKLKESQKTIPNIFKSSHWDEPNIISHLRLNERTYQGKKVTFMEELQSDWAREGRSKGFQYENPDAESLILENQIKSLTDKYPNASGTRTPEIQNQINELGDKMNAIHDSKSGVPNNPLLKNWQQTSVKRALKEAVDSNSEYFAWINGEQTSARYDLATKLDNVEWKMAGDKKSITLTPTGKKETIKVYLNKDGKIHLAPSSDEWEGKKLDEVLGKGLADKIMEKESGTLSGDGLKFGGEWANTLYDKRVGNIVKDLTGAKVENLDMGLPVDKNTTKTTTQQGIRLTPEIKAIIKSEAPTLKAPSGKSPVSTQPQLESPVGSSFKNTIKRFFDERGGAQGGYINFNSPHREPKKSGKQLAKEETDRLFAERERKVAREYIERKTTNRAEYDPGYFARKETLENNLKTTRQIEKQTKPPQISQQSSQTIPNSKALVGRTMSEGEAKSIEIQAKQAIDIMAGGKIPDGVSLHKIISETVTPVTKKVNFIDTFLRTPDRVMAKIGFGKNVVELRRAMDAYWKELPKNIAKNTEWAKRVPKESNERIFKYLDGQAIDLRPDEKQVALEIRAWLEQWADRLKLPKSQRVSEYITRLFDEELLAKEFPEELAKIIADKVPGSVYNPFMLRRLGAKGYKQDTWAALDAYVKRATRKVHMDPVLEKMQAKTGQSLEMANIEKSQFKYVQRYVENINMRPSEIEESIDNFLKSSPLGYKFGQRPVASISQFLRRISFRAGLGLNLGSALRNLSQGANTYSELGEKYTTLGYVGLFKKGAREELIREGVLNAGFIQDRVLSSTAKIIERMDKGLFAMFQGAEYINRGAAYFGAKSKALSAGKSIDEAIEYAKGIVRKTQFSFDSVDTPVGMSSNIAKTVMQFQTFTMKQMEFLGEKAKGSVTGKEKVKNVIGLLRYAAAGTVFVYTIGRAFGMEPRELIPIYRIGAPPALVPIVETGKAALDTPDKYGNQRELKTKAIDVGKSFLGYVPAGPQIKKSFLGDQAVRQGGSFDKGGNLQFKVGETTGQKIQARLFGKYAGPQSDKYFNRAEEAQKLNKEAERTYDELLALPKSEGDHRFTQLEKDNPKLADKLKTIGRDRKLGITEKDRELRAFGVTNGDRAQRVLDYILELPSEADQDKLYDELVKKKIITSVVAKQIKELMQSR